MSGARLVYTSSVLCVHSLLLHDGLGREGNDTFRGAENKRAPDCKSL